MVTLSVPEGVIVPIHTPFLEDGSVDYEGLESEMDRLERAGIQWILATAVAGEWVSLTMAERKRVVERVVATRRSLKILVFAGANLVEDELELISHAEKTGADAVMISGPYIYGFPQVDIYNHYAFLTGHTSLPFVVYNNPGSTGLRIEPDTIAQLSRLPNVVGLKDSSRNAREALEIRAKAEPKFKVIGGEGDLFMSSLACGAEGGMPVPALLFPRHFLSMYDNFRSGNASQAMADWDRVWPLIATLGSGGRYLPMSKVAQEMLQRPAGRCRPPLAQTVEEEARRRLREALDQLVAGGAE